MQTAAQAVGEGPAEKSVDVPGHWRDGRRRGAGWNPAQRHRVFSAPRYGYSSYLTLRKRANGLFGFIPARLTRQIEEFDGKPNLQKMVLQVRSPIGAAGFTLLIHESEKRHEQINVRLVEEWQRRYSAQAENRGPQEKVMAAATALVVKLGWAPLDEDFEDSKESAIFA